MKFIFLKCGFVIGIMKLTSNNPVNLEMTTYDNMSVWILRFWHSVGLPLYLVWYQESE